MQASGAGSYCTILLLLEYGAEVNAVDSEGRSALMYACQLKGRRTRRRPDLTCVKALIRHGADIDHRDSTGRTALILTVMGLSDEGWGPFPLVPTLDAQTACLSLLLEHGADLTVADDEGRTVRDIGGVSDVVRAMLEKAQHRNDHIMK